MSLKLVSLNIERDKHLGLVVPFLKKSQSDIVCVQELLESSIPQLEGVAGGKCIFTPMNLEQSGELFGVGIISHLEVISSSARQYGGKSGDLAVFAFKDKEEKYATQRYVLAVVDVRQGGESYRIATTHFVWTPDGQPDDHQRQDLKNLLVALEDQGDMVLCGDFNAPRGGEIFSEFTQHFKDNIPLQYETSIDVNFHRVGKVRPDELTHKMVDGLFTTPGYRAQDVRLEFGVSDHAAIVATIAKV